MFSPFTQRRALRTAVLVRRSYAYALPLFLLALLSALLLTARFHSRAAGPEQTNLLQNGSFEAGPVGLALTSIPGWTITRGNVDVLSGSPSDPSGVWQQAADGGKSLDLNGTPGVGTIRQSFATEAGRQYVLTGWVAHHYGTSEAGANVYVNGIPLTALYHNTPNAQGNLRWASFSREFTATSSTTTLTLEDRNLAGYEFGGTLLDGLAVTPAAPQTTVTVLDQRIAAQVVSNNCVAPQSKTVFAPTDAYVFHWTSFTGIRVNDTIRWEFIQPNGSVYFANQETFTFSGSGCAWEGIQIAGQPAAQLPGNWQVRVIYNGSLLLTGQFTISGVVTPPPPTIGAAIIIDGTDANDHGSASGGKNVRGWLYMQKALESLASMVSPGTAKVVVDLGTSTGEARRAIDSAFNLSSLKNTGWTLNHVDGAANITAWLTSLSTANTGILYLPTYNLTSGDLEADEMTAINAQATQIANFANRGSGNGGALFAMGEVNTGSEARAWGWLRALFPGLNFVQVASGSDLVLTPDGAAAFPGLTDPDLQLASGELWHNHFTGELGTLKVLATAPDSDRVTRNVIIGGIGIIIPPSTCPSLSSFGPTSGRAGSTVVLNGNNLLGVSAVKFANNVSASFTVNSNTQLTATVPSGALTGPITISKPNCPDVSTTAPFVVAADTRLVRVGCGSAQPGGTLTLPLELTAQGNENALGLSLSFDPVLLSNPQITLGTDAPFAQLNVNSNQASQGRIGLAIALPSGQTFAPGTRQFARVSFRVATISQSTATAVQFADTPIRRQVASANAESLSAEYQGCSSIFIEANNGYEGDVTPRPTGKNDGSISITDWVLVGRFAAGLEIAANGGEFQRADCAPRTEKGNGQISVVDWVQAGRYAAGLDAPERAGGPTAPTALFSAPGETSADLKAAPEVVAHGRHLRVRDTTLQRGQAGDIAIEIEAEGDENAFGISLEFDPATLSFVSAAADSALGNALLNVNQSQLASGRLGLALALPAGVTLKEGTRTLLRVRFTALSNSNANDTTVRFSDQPIRRQLADASANAIAGHYEDGAISIGNLVTSVSAASFQAEAAAESILAAFGTKLARETASATQFPLPTTLANTSVTVKDSLGTQRPAPLFFVAPEQINYLLPPGTMPGAATVTVSSADGITATGTINVTAVAPSLFTANANGQGVPAAVLLRVSASGEQRYEPVTQFDAAQNRVVPVPIILRAESEQLFLLLFGTGMRHRTSLLATSARIGDLPVEVLYAGAQGNLAGLDQLNLRLPRTLAGRGLLNVQVTVDGRNTNTVQLAFASTP